MTTAEKIDEAPVEVIEEDDQELRVRFPVLVIEGLDTSDGRFLTEGSLTHRALPLTLFAQPESSHGGDEPGPSITSGRIDTLERVPGAEVVSSRTGEPFPDGTFIWRGTGVVSKAAEYKGQNIAEMVARRYLRGVSVDLVGMDYEILGEEGFADVDPENPRRQLVTHAAEIGAATLVGLPAFSDAYVEVEGVDPPAELPELVASAVPSWRSIEVGDDVPALTAAGGVVTIEFPPGANDELARVIDLPGEERDAGALAADLIAYMTENWQPGGTEAEPAEDAPVPDGMADTGEVPDVADVEPPTEEGRPDQPQPCEFGEEPAVVSLLFGEGMYTPVCAEHRADAEATIAEMGEEVTDVVEIQPGTDETAEEVV